MQTTIYLVVQPVPTTSTFSTIPLFDLPRLIAEHLASLDLPGWKIKEVR